MIPISIFKERNVKVLLLRRYESLKSFKKVIASYKDIGDATGVREATVRQVINRFHANGNKYKKKNKT